MVAMHNADPHKDPVGWIKRWIDREIGEETTFKIPVIANKLTDVILADKGFLAAYVRVSLRDQVYEHVRRHVAKTRNIVVLGNGDVHERDVYPERAAEVSAVRGWYEWSERVGKQHIVLKDITREELFDAATLRRQQAEPHLELADFFERLAKQLRPEQKLSDKFSEQQVEALYQQVRKERAARAKKEE